MRNLAGAEADLVRDALRSMLDRHVALLRKAGASWADETDAEQDCGLEWFDQWDVNQRLWLLDQVTSSLLGDLAVDSPAAMFDATVDAIFLEIVGRIEVELEQATTELPDQSARATSWRQAVMDALRESSGEAAFNDIAPDCGAMDRWHAVVTRIADAILGVRLYQRAEGFRDLDYQRTENFLRDRGLPEDYLRRIPPLRTRDQTEASIQRMESFLIERNRCD